MPRTIDFQGKRIEVPDDASDEQVAKILRVVAGRAATMAPKQLDDRYYAEASWDEEPALARGMAEAGQRVDRTVQAYRSPQELAQIPGGEETDYDRSTRMLAQEREAMGDTDENAKRAWAIFSEARRGQRPDDVSAEFQRTFDPRSPATEGRLSDYVKQSDALTQRQATRVTGTARAARLVLGLGEGVVPGARLMEDIGPVGREAVAQSRESDGFGMNVAEGLSRGVGAVSTMGVGGAALGGGRAAEAGVMAAQGALSDTENPVRGAAHALAFLGLGSAATAVIAKRLPEIPLMARPAFVSALTRARAAASGVGGGLAAGAVMGDDAEAQATNAALMAFLSVLHSGGAASAARAASEAYVEAGRRWSAAERAMTPQPGFAEAMGERVGPEQQAHTRQQRQGAVEVGRERQAQEAMRQQDAADRANVDTDARIQAILPSAGPDRPALPMGAIEAPPVPKPAPYEAAVEAFRNKDAKPFLRGLEARRALDGLKANELLAVAREAGVDTRGVRNRTQVRERIMDAARDEASRPPPATRQQASEAIETALERGDLSMREAAAPRVYDALKAGQTPPEAVRAPRDQYEGGYNPRALEEGQVHPAIEPEVRAAQAEGKQTVSSGPPDERGPGYVVTRDPATGEVEVRRPKSSTVEPPSARSLAARKGALKRPGQSLSTFIDRQGGINAGGEWSGEVRRLGRLARKNSRFNVEDMMQSARESGYPVPEDMHPGDFLEMVEREGKTIRADYGEVRARDAEDKARYEEWAKANPKEAREQAKAAELGRWFEEQGREAGFPPPNRLGGEAGFLMLPDLTPAAKAVGEGIAQTGGYVREAVRRLQGPAGRITGGRGSAPGDEIASSEVRADTEARRYAAEVEPQSDPALRAAQGGLGPKGAAAREAQQVSGRNKYLSNYTDWLENGGTPTTPEGQAIKATSDALLEATWEAQVRRNFTRTKNGVEVPMTSANRPRNVKPVALNPKGREIRNMGPTHDDWSAWVDAHEGVNPGKPRAQVEAWLQKESEDAGTSKVFGSEGHMASEFGRTMNRPDFIYIDGKPVPVQIVNPHQYVTHLMGPGARTVGAQVVFGRGSKSRVAALIEAHNQTKAGRQSPMDADTAMRSIFGMDPAPAKRNALTNPPIGGVVDHIGAGYDLLANTVRVGARTLPVWQVPDLGLGGQAVLTGIKDTIVGLGQTLKNLGSRIIGRGETQAMKALVASGGRTESIPNRSVDIWKNKVAEAWRRVLGSVTEGTATPFDEGQEATSGFATKAFTKKLVARAGRFGAIETERLAIRLQAFADIPLTEARAFLHGQLPPERVSELVAQIEGRGSSRATGSNVAPSQRSALASSWVSRRMLTFYKWFENNAATSARFADAASKSFQQGNRVAATAEMTRFLAYKALNGAAANMLAAYLIPGYDDAASEWKEMRGDPIGYFLKAAMFNAVGGSIGNLVANGGIQLSRTLPGRMARMFTAPADRTLPFLRVDPGGERDHGAQHQERAQRRKKVYR